jgi:hypothetical protein
MSRLRKLVFVMLILIAALPSVSGCLSSVTANALPYCWDMYQRCSGSQEYCDGVWCGCMAATYGYQCANFESGGDHRSIEESLIDSQQ